MKPPPLDIEILRGWVEREFVVAGVDFELVLVGFTERPEGDRAYFKIQYADGEFNEGTVLEVYRQNSSGRTFYSEYEVNGMMS